MRVASAMRVQGGEHPAGEKPPSQETEYQQKRHHDGRGRSETAQEVGVAADQEDHTRVYTTRKGEVPGGEQYGTCDHQEAGVAEGELEASTETGRSIHALSVRPGVWLRVDAVPDAGHGGDEPGLAEPFAQSRDRDAHGVGERVCVLIPRPFQ